MRLLLLSHNYAPELTGIGKYNGEMCEWLAEQGYEVRVVTAPPHYPEWRIAKGYRRFLYQSETLSGIDVWRCPIWVPKKPRGLTRILSQLSFAISSFPVMIRMAFWKPDITLCIEPPIMCTPTALLTASLCRGKAWLHVQDFEVDVAFELGVVKSRGLMKIVSAIEKALMRKFYKVSTISSAMLKRLKAKELQESQTFLFPNWVDIHQISPIETHTSYRDELNIPSSSIVLLYSGNIGQKQGLEILIEAARALADRSDIAFIICGSGAMARQLKESSKDLHNIHWLPLQPLNKLNELLGTADIHLLPQKPDVAELLMPSKLLGMLASGRPVLATAGQETEVALAIEGAGRRINPGDTQAFTQEIVSLAENPELRRELGEQARKHAINRFSQEHILTQLDGTLKNL